MHHANKNMGCTIEVNVQKYDVCSEMPIVLSYIAQLTTTFVTIPLTQKSCHFVIFKSLENLSYNKFQVMCFETIAK